MFTLTLTLTLTLMLEVESAQAYMFSAPGSGDFEASLVLSFIILIGFGFVAIRIKPELLIFALLFAFCVGAFAEDGPPNIEKCVVGDPLSPTAFNESVSLIRKYVQFFASEKCADVAEPSPGCIKERNQASESKKCISEIRLAKWCLSNYYICDFNDLDSYVKENTDKWIKEVKKTKNIARQKIYLMKIASLLNNTIGIRMIEEAAKTHCLLKYIAENHYHIESMIEELLFDDKIKSKTLSEWIVISSDSDDILHKMAKSSMKEAFSVKRILTVVSVASMLYVLLMVVGPKVVKGYSIMICITIISFAIVMIMF